MKIAKITPIFKSGDSMLFNNYRPISVLPVFSKILEKLMYNRMIAYINSRKILYPLQFGFRELHNTATALTYSVDKIISSISDGNFVIGVFVDLSKAFDTVNHSILLAKLYRYGIRGNAYDWLASYLSNRYQFTCYNNVNSTQLKITCVPQGSILGPLLFLLYINDLVKVSDKLVPIMYADDTSFFISGRDLNTVINYTNNELCKIMNWTRANKLSVNIEKTSYIIFRPKRKALPSDILDLKLDNQQIIKVRFIKFLGVILDETMSWAEQINNIKNKISKGMGIILKARKSLQRNTLLTLYYSFIYPHLIYCIDSWGSACATHLLSVFRLQKKVLRIIKCVPRCYESKKLFAEFQVLSLSQLHHYSVAIFMYKYKIGKLPGVFHSFFQANPTVYPTRSQHLLQIPLCTSVLSQKRIRYIGVKVHNYFSDKISITCSYHSYKRKLKGFFLDHWDTIV